MTTSRYASLNMRNTADPFPIRPAEAEAGLLDVLDRTDVIGLQEWAGTARNRILRDHGTLTLFPPMTAWVPLGKSRTQVTGWTFVRPRLGGPALGFRANRYEVRWVKAKLLAGPGRVDKVPGYRSLLGPSFATVAAVRDLELNVDEIVVDYHLTTHVETGGRYRPEVPKRVARHKRERAALEAVAAHHLTRRRRVTMIGDSNYHDLPIAGLLSCFDSPLTAPFAGGTLGGRRVDLIHSSSGHAQSVEVRKSLSDHRHPIATYPR